MIMGSDLYKLERAPEVQKTKCISRARLRQSQTKEDGTIVPGSQPIETISKVNR